MKPRNIASVFAAVAAVFSLASAQADDANPATPVTVPAMAVARTHDCASFYPVKAARLNEMGTVFLNYDVGVDGKIRNVTIKEKSDFDDLDAAALACVTQRWQETPETRDGVPVESPGHTATVSFILDNGDAQTFYREGMHAAHAEFYPMAVYAFTHALQFDPTLKDAYYQRGLSYDQMYDREHALADYAQAGVAPPPARVPPPTGAAIAIGLTHDCGGDYPLLSAQLFESGHVLLQYDVGADGAVANVVLLKSSGVERLDQAALACVRARWRDVPARLNGVAVASLAHQATVAFAGGEPRSALQFYTRGHALSGLGEYVRAVADFDQAILLDPNLAFAYRARADAYDALGQHDRADADRSTLKSLKVDANQAPTPH